MKKRFLFAVIFTANTLLAKIDEPEEIGNFSLPTSQQMGPLFGFGQNIVDRGDKLFYFDANQVNGKRKKLSLLIPGFVYGIRDTLSLYLFLPIIPSTRNGCHTSYGISDFTTQLEYTYLNNPTASTLAQGTIVGAITIPNGSSKTNPNIGLGSPSFFLGTTLDYMTQWWSVWIQGGALLTTAHKQKKSGNSFLYQGGLERCFAARKGWIFAGLLELIGIYEQGDTTQGHKNLNTEGHSFWLAPSVYASNKKCIIQFGVGIPVVQHLQGKQNKYDYWIAFNLGYTF